MSVRDVLNQPSPPLMTLDIMEFIPTQTPSELHPAA